MLQAKVVRFRFRESVILWLAILSCTTGRCDDAAQLPVLADLEKTESISLRDGPGWWSEIGPIESEYRLKREDKSFTGQATFSAYDAKTKQRRQVVADINIPLAVAQAAFKLLDGAPLKDEKYEPPMNKTDYYPYIGLTLKLKEEDVTFFTSSQSEDHLPWAVKYKEETYVVHSDAPAKAYRALLPHLKKDVLQQLIKEAFRH